MADFIGYGWRDHVYHYLASEQASVLRPRKLRFRNVVLVSTRNSLVKKGAKVKRKLIRLVLGRYKRGYGKNWILIQTLPNALRWRMAIGPLGAYVDENGQVHMLLWFWKWAISVPWLLESFVDEDGQMGVQWNLWTVRRRRPRFRK